MFKIYNYAKLIILRSYFWHSLTFKTALMSFQIYTAVLELTLGSFYNAVDICIALRVFLVKSFHSTCHTIHQQKNMHLPFQSFHLKFCWVCSTFLFSKFFHCFSFIPPIVCFSSYCLSPKDPRFRNYILTFLPFLLGLFLAPFFFPVEK